jgi:circadian clock protein KaiC
VFTSLTSKYDTEDPSVSSLIDTWIQLANEVVDGTLCRSMYVRKSRGMAHSGKVRVLQLGEDGIHLADGPGS